LRKSEYCISHVSASLGDVEHGSIVQTQLISE
jgi:hypothetical protein